MTQKLSPTEINAIYAYLSVDAIKPTLRNLNDLIDAYVRKVPWESLTRILKQRRTMRLENCPRWPAEFWQDAIDFDTGGTCFETNYAFFTLLQAVGYMGYMTVNDMGDTPGCHSAIIILLSGCKYLVDVSLPFDRAIPLHSSAPTTRTTPLQTVIIRPLGSRRYQVTRTHHPHKDIFTLVDVPVTAFDYECVLTRDYLPTGWFLDKIVIVKTIGQKIWRFNSSITPFKIETVGSFDSEQILLDPRNLSAQLSQHFGISIQIVAGAVGQILPGLGPQKSVISLNITDSMMDALMSKPVLS